MNGPQWLLLVTSLALGVSATILVVRGNMPPAWVVITLVWVIVLLIALLVVNQRSA